MGRHRRRIPVPPPVPSVKESNPIILSNTTSPTTANVNPSKPKFIPWCKLCGATLVDSKCPKCDKI